MKAVVVREFGGIENAKLAELPKPQPKAGEVLLEARQHLPLADDRVEVGREHLDHARNLGADLYGGHCLECACG